MYHHHSSPSGSGRRGVVAAGLPMTPSVALRALLEQLQGYRRLLDSGVNVDLFLHFSGPLTPPIRHQTRPMVDPVIDAIAAYASAVVGRAGLLTSQLGTSEASRLENHGRLTRQLFTVEHAVAIEFARNAPSMALRPREVAARAVLALASYWCDRDELLGLGTHDGHPLLGHSPEDAVGHVLFEHAVLALAAPERPRSGGAAQENSGPDLGIEIGIAPAA